MAGSFLWQLPILSERPRRTRSKLRMRRILALLLLVSPAVAQSPPFIPVATISEIMDAITLPYSDALLYIERNPPKSDRDWEVLQMQAVMLAESGNLLMMKDRAKNQDEWMTDSKLLVDAGIAAVKATRAKDIQA